MKMEQAVNNSDKDNEVLNDIVGKKVKLPRAFQCTLCHGRFVDAASFRQHHTIVKDRIQFFCMICNEMLKFGSHCKINQHKMLHSDIVQISEITNPTVTTNTNTNLPTIMNVCSVTSCTHDKSLISIVNNAYKCSGCDAILCPECSAVIETTLQNHFLSSDSGTTYSCQNGACSLFFLSKCALRAHVRLHSEEKPYVCPDCGIVNNDIKYLIEHMMNTCYHVYKTLRYSCHGCPSTLFFNRSDFNRHLVKHIWNIYKCELCPFFATRYEHVTTHQSEVHESVQIVRVKRCIRCEFCPSKCFPSFSEHYKTHYDSHIIRFVLSCSCYSTFESTTNFETHRKNCRLKSVLPDLWYTLSKHLATSEPSPASDDDDDMCEEEFEKTPEYNETSVKQLEQLLSGKNIVQPTEKSLAQHGDEENVENGDEKNDAQHNEVVNVVLNSEKDLQEKESKKESPVLKIAPGFTRPTIATSTPILAAQLQSQLKVKPFSYETVRNLSTVVNSHQISTGTYNRPVVFRQNLTQIPAFTRTYQKAGEKIDLLNAVKCPICPVRISSIKNRLGLMAAHFKIFHQKVLLDRGDGNTKFYVVPDEDDNCSGRRKEVTINLEEDVAPKQPAKKEVTIGEVTIRLEGEEEDFIDFDPKPVEDEVSREDLVQEVGEEDRKQYDQEVAVDCKSFIEVDDNTDCMVRNVKKTDSSSNTSHPASVGTESRLPVLVQKKQKKVGSDKTKGKIHEIDCVCENVVSRRGRKKGQFDKGINTCDFIKPEETELTEPAVEQGQPLPAGSFCLFDNVGNANLLQSGTDVADRIIRTVPGSMARFSLVPTIVQFQQSVDVLGRPSQHVVLTPAIVKQDVEDDKINKENIPSDDPVKQVETKKIKSSKRTSSPLSAETKDEHKVKKCSPDGRENSSDEASTPPKRQYKKKCPAVVTPDNGKVPEREIWDKLYSNLKKAEKIKNLEVTDSDIVANLSDSKRRVKRPKRYTVDSESEDTDGSEEEQDDEKEERKEVKEKEKEKTKKGLNKKEYLLSQLKSESNVDMLYTILTSQPTVTLTMLPPPPHRKESLDSTSSSNDDKPLLQRVTKTKEESNSGRKRGRPRKYPPKEEVEKIDKVESFIEKNFTNDDVSDSSTNKRRRKLSSRLLFNKKLEEKEESQFSSGQVVNVQKETEQIKQQCTICKLKYQTVDEFHKHIKTHRSDENLFQCMECGQCFVVKPSLEKHLLVFHKIQHIPKYFEENDCFKLNPEPVEEPLKEFQCEVCRDQFNNSAELNKHFRVHGMAFIKSRANTSS